MSLSRLFILTLVSASLAVVSAETVRAQRLEESVVADISVALTGDTIVTRSLSTHKEPSFLKLIELIRAQDAAFTNLDISLHEYETYPMAESIGIHLTAPPHLARELAWSGFKLVSFANNHALDWGVEGMRLTRRHALEAGLVVAGVGESLAEARRAQFLEMSKGRIALVASASTFTPSARAGDSLGDMPARPGLSPLRFTTTNVLTRTGMSSLRIVAGELGETLPHGERLSFLQQSFVVGERPGRRTAPHQQDVKQIAAAVREGRELSNLTIVSIHAHESGADRHTPAEFLITFARAMIDAGADAVVGHGPHVLRGIEIYNGRPILYSLGNFAFQNETVERLPLDDYERFGADPAKGVAGLNDVRYDSGRRGFPARREVWESVVAVARWHNGVIQSIELHPISLGFGQPRMLRGRPRLAEEELSRKIIGDLRRLSGPFGTTIHYRNGIGIVELDSWSSSLR